MLVYQLILKIIIQKYKRFLSVGTDSPGETTGGQGFLCEGTSSTTFLSHNLVVGFLLSLCPALIVLTTPTNFLVFLSFFSRCSRSCASRAAARIDFPLCIFPPVFSGTVGVFCDSSLLLGC